MTRNLLNTINIDVPAAVVDETIVFWSAASAPRRCERRCRTTRSSAMAPTRTGS